ncbi:MAG: glycosyltransferase [Candidatus Rehaiarchaeum fermentans]|nr:glycosyltransferase [Candidatus Rehaiarchaeum fermentans]
MRSNYVVIPTYKEVDNLKVLLPKLSKYEVIIVDDNSQDGTIELCNKFKNVHVLVRPKKEGISSAVLEGIKLLPQNSKVVVMDADLQHDFKLLSKIFNKLEKYDFVECVRINKSSMSFIRRVISNISDLLFLAFIPETKVLKDRNTGFFGFRLESVDIKKLRPGIGEWKIVIDIFLALKRGSKITSISYFFGKRKYGKSKLSLASFFYTFKQLLRLNDYRIFKFAFVGFLGLIVNESILFYFVKFLRIQEYISLVFSIEGSTLFNFVLLKEFVFDKRQSKNSLLKFHLAVLYSLVINYLAALYLSIFVNYLFANFLGILISFIFRYFYSEHKVWTEFSK